MLDWTRLTRGRAPEGKAPDKQGSQSLYRRQRDTDAIKQAERQGFFLHPTRRFIKQAFAPDVDDGNRWSAFCDDNRSKDLSRVHLIALPSAHLRNVGDMGMCTNLTICILSHNFIRRIDELALCRNLIKLDLSHNQISILPGMDFWLYLGKLQILYLHDNPLWQIECLSQMAAARRLTLLTLYDTPVSLKKNYRHHAVNSIWTLKALDNYAVSDEEIIEDAKFGGYFSCYHPSLRLKTFPIVDSNASYEEHAAVVRQTLAAVNSVLAHCSPVLMIQKTIRGFLVRRRLKANTWLCFLMSDEDKLRRQRAAVTIQRYYREWKGLPRPAKRVVIKNTEPMSPIFGTCPNVDLLKMDYDMYLQHRRPGSSARSVTFHTSSSSLDAITKAKGRSSAGSASSNQLKGLFIDFTKLQEHTMQALQDDPMSTIGIEQALLDSDGSHVIAKRPRKKEIEGKLKRIMDVKQFFGPVVKTSNTPEPVTGDEDFSLIHFRLRGFRKAIHGTDPTTELIITRREAGKVVRNAEFVHHMVVDNEKKPHIKKKAGSGSSLRQRISRSKTTMSLSCLRAVQDAYKERQKMEQQALRLEYVLGLKEQREAARDRIKSFRVERRNQVLRDRTLDAKCLMEELDHHNMQHITSLEKSGEHRSKSSQYWRQRRGEFNFMADFNIQNTSVSNALMRHDRQAVQEDKLQERLELVQAHKVVEQEQQDIVSKYLEHRQLMRQAEAAMSRAAIDTKMLKEANERLIEARSRVKQQKLKTGNVKPTLTLPIVVTPSLPSVTKEVHSAFAERPIFLRTGGLTPWTTSSMG